MCSAVFPHFDLVRLDNVSLFMPTNDNLYNVVVPQASKRFDVKRHQEMGSVVLDVANSDVRHVMLKYLAIFGRRGVPVHMLDIGAWVGDVAIRWAKLAKQNGYVFSAECYDPSFAGKFIPFNTVLNDVDDCVKLRPLGLSVEGGALLFSQIEGHSDSSRIGNAVQPHHQTQQYFVQTVTLAECLASLPLDRHAIVKIDVEGIDAELVMPNLERLKDFTLIVEFAPHQAQYKNIGASAFLKTLQQSHSLFDLYYLPSPTRSTQVLDADQFTAEITRRPYGYTDVLAVPHSSIVYSELMEMLQAQAPLAPSYMMAE